MSESNNYFAFISYNSKDEKWAKWLWHNLEYYHIPSTLCEEHPQLPRKIRPVFWYKQDLSGTKLKSSLDEALNSSKYLIVICSPHSAQSYWVNEEVKSFIAQGKGDKIIPFVVDGSLDDEDDDEEMCLPPALRNFTTMEELRSIDVRRKEGKYHALVDVVATMLGVRFDTLWQRHERRKKKIRNIWLAIITIFLLLALGIYEYTRTEIEYYTDYVESYGIPQGLFKLDTKEQRRSRSMLYQFRYKRVPIGEKNALSWRVAEIVTVNSAGTIIENPAREFSTRYSINRYFYSSTTGNLREVHYCDALKKIILKLKVSSHNSVPATIYDISGSSDDDASGYLNAYTMFSSAEKMLMPIQKSGIKRYVYKRDQNGFATGVTFHSSNADDFEESAMPDANGVYGIDYRLDSLGRCIEYRLLDQNGNSTYGINGVSCVRLEYSDAYIVSRTCFDANDKPTLDENLVCKTQYLYDADGNLILERYYDTDMQRTYNKDMVSGKEGIYNNRGNLEKVLMLNAFDQPTITNLGINHILHKYDALGRQVETSYRDVSGFLRMCKDQYALIKVKYHKNSVLPNYAEFYNTDFNLINTPNGAAFERGIDKHGNVVWENYYNTDWVRAKNSLGIARVEREYENNNLIKECFFDENDAPCLNNDSVHGFVYRYNNRGSVSSLTMIDIDGSTIENSTNGVAIIKYEYNKQGHPEVISFYDRNNQKVINTKVGFHKRHFSFNKFGVPYHIVSYGTNDSLCCDPNGLAVEYHTFDSLGNTVKIQFYDQDSLLCNTIEGFSTIVMGYDKHRLKTLHAFYDTADSLVENNAGVAKYVMEYNDQGRQTLYSEYNKANKLYDGEDGISTVISDYDAQGLLLEMQYLNSKGQLSVAQNVGYAKITYQYDNMGNHIASTAYGADGRVAVSPLTGFAKYNATYDSEGRIVKRQLFDEADTLVYSPLYGYATWQATYDEDGTLLEVQRYDADGNIIVEESNKKLENETENTSDYNKNYFRYNRFDTIVGMVFLLIAIITTWLCIRTMRSRSREGVWPLALASIILFGISWNLCCDYFLHIGIITPRIYNHSWMLYILPIICCVIIVVWIVPQIKDSFMQIWSNWVLIRRQSQEKWYKQLYKAFDATIVYMFIFLCGVGSFIYLFTDAIIYILRNPY